MEHKRQRILRNAAKCFTCRRVIESTDRREPVRCSCRDVTISGGKFKFGLVVKENAHYILLREVEEVPCTSELEDTPFGRRCYACGFEDAAG